MASIAGRRLSVAFVVTTAGYAYAINAAAAGIAPGAILWRRRLTDAPCDKGMMGNFATPVIDRALGRLYVTSCSGAGWTWRAHALDLRTGADLAGWPLAIDAAAMNRPGINRNGSTRWIDGQTYIQRGALNLSRDGSRLYVAFGPDTQGWLLSIDTATPRIASAFSSTPAQQEEQGGMWGSAGATWTRRVASISRRGPVSSTRWRSAASPACFPTARIAGANRSCSSAMRPAWG